MRTTRIPVIDPRIMSDNDLLNYSILFGKVALRARNKFIGSLPEIARRGIYQKKGFESVFHYAKITGGVSVEQVRTVLNLARQFDKFPNLSRLLMTGIVSINKLVRITSAVNVENEEEWANHVQILSNRALETLVRDYKNARIDDVTVARDFEDPSEFQTADNPKKSWLSEANKPSSELHVQLVPQSNSVVLNLDSDVRAALVELQRKNIDINEELREFLAIRKAKIEQEKAELAKLDSEKVNNGEISRAIPTHTKRLLKKEFGDLCALTDCNKKSVEIHHTNRFSMSRSHNPYYLAPLCHEHHQIAHSIDVKVMLKRLC